MRTVAIVGGCGENPFMPEELRRVRSAPGPKPFRPGALVVVTLGNPREKLWGAILALSIEGLSLCGIELASFDDLVAMVKEGEQAAPSVVFFPMHRVERIELDLPNGKLPSLSQRFAAKTGLQPSQILVSDRESHVAREESA